jgi:hypothetical protein
VTCGRTRGVAQLCRGAGEGDPSLVPTNETCPPLSSFHFLGRDETAKGVREEGTTS